LREIKTFVAEVEQAGAWLHNPNERHDAQLILDTWAATLATASDREARDWVLPRLAEFVRMEDQTKDEPAHSESRAGSIRLAGGDIERAREQIRLAALARQWRMGERKPGYLLTGRALEDAKPFRGADPEIEGFIRASEDASALTLRRWVTGLSVLAVILIALSAAAFWQALAARYAAAQAQQERADAEAARDAQRTEADLLRTSNQELERSTQQLAAAREAQERLAQEAGAATAQRIRDLEVSRRDLNLALDVIRRGIAEGQLQASAIPEGLRPLTEPEPSRGAAASVAQPGYQRDFLPNQRAPIDMPHLRAGPAGPTLNYLNYSLVMNEERRVPLLSGSNVDRSRLRVLSRPPSRFKPDPRLPADRQLDPEWFRRSGFDRGHLVSRREIAWGDLAPEDAVAAEQVAAQVDVMTNIIPQTSVLNRSGWAALERWALTEYNQSARTITIFSGPVLRADDPSIEGVQVPRAFWKVLVSPRGERDVGPEAGAAPPNLVVEAFLLSQFAEGSNEHLPDVGFDQRRLECRSTILRL
jgi:DNA/RNA endonuclease G (NUC1)